MGTTSNQKAIVRRKRSDIKYKEREVELLAKLSNEERHLAFLYKGFCLNTSINDYDGEIWFDVPEWEGFYKISNFLRLKSVRRNKIKPPRINCKSYFDTSFHTNGHPKYYIYSRLIALIFVPNPKNKPEVNHKNGIRWDNRPSNLEWSDAKGNIDHAINTLGSTNRKTVLQLDLNGNLIKEWKSLGEIENELGYSSGNICIVCNKKNAYTAYGFKWEYKA